MKRFTKQFILCFIVLTGCLLCGSAASAKKVPFDKKHFPDAQVRKAVGRQARENSALKMYKGKKVVETDEVEYLTIRKAKNLKGVGYFTELESLSIYDYKGRTISLKNKQLDYLYINSKTLGRINVGSLKKLKYLYLYSTYSLKKINGLDKLTKLTALDISCSKLDSLQVSACRNLSSLSLTENTGNISSLDFSKNRKLSYLNIALSNVSSLDVSRNNKLTSLSCYGTKLSWLNIPQNVNYLASYNNNIPYYQLPAKDMTLAFECPVGGQIFLAHYIGTGYTVAEVSPGIYYDAKSGAITVGAVNSPTNSITLTNGSRRYDIVITVK